MPGSTQGGIQMRTYNKKTGIEVISAEVGEQLPENEGLTVIRPH